MMTAKIPIGNSDFFPDSLSYFIVFLYPLVYFCRGAHYQRFIFKKASNKKTCDINLPYER